MATVEPASRLTRRRLSINCDHKGGSSRLRDFFCHSARPPVSRPTATTRIIVYPNEKTSSSANFNDLLSFLTWPISSSPSFFIPLPEMDIPALLRDADSRSEPEFRALAVSYPIFSLSRRRVFECSLVQVVYATPGCR